MDVQLKHPTWIRWTHWVNFPLLALMIWSGTLIYWANRVYVVLPEELYRALRLDHGLALGMGWHFAVGWLFFVNGLLYAGYVVFSGAWRELLPVRRDFATAHQVFLHDLGLRRTPPPQGKFNPAQKIVYTGIALAGFASVVTGLAIYKPTQLHWLTSLLGGYEAARFEHFLLMLGFLGFFVVHVLQVARAGWGNFLSMICGYERVRRSR
jgi:thiosulfate reductase cytochrome b subunit